MNVSEVCSREVVCVTGAESIVTAAKLMREEHVGSVVVVDREEGERTPIGLLTDRDLVVEILAAEVDMHSVSVGDVMSDQLVTLGASLGIDEAVEEMRRHGVRRGPVVDAGGKLVGILALDDVVGVIAGQVLALVNLMKREERREQRARR